MAMVLLLLAAPTIPAQAGDLPDVECIEVQRCEPDDVCLFGPGCAANPCGLVGICSAALIFGYECQEDPVIEGETCQRTIGVESAASSGSTRAQSARVALILTDGNVSSFNLRNVWFSHAAQARLTAVAVDTGELTLLAYRSDIDSSNDNHVTQLGLGFDRSGGSGPVEDLTFVAGIVLYEFEPRGCFVHAQPGTDVECPPGVLLTA